MKAQENDKKRSLAATIAHCKCPRCRHGDMFIQSNPYRKNFMKMHDECEVCGQPFDLEVGFYYGSSYVSYALCIAISVASFIAWWLLIGVSINDSRVYWWLAFNAGLLIAGQPVLMRVARSGWLAVFVRHNPNWRNEKAPATERMIEKFKNAW